MASKTAQQGEPDKANIEELLDYVDKTLDRVKVLYEQYFLGIQKAPPTHIHADVERRLRELMQIQIRNTGLRYRFATLQQKFGSYNSYWRRTLRQIENGTYIRNLSKLSRRAAQTGEEIPEEILAAMPKRMRDQVRRDREAALAIARRREQTQNDELGPGFDDEDGPVGPAMITDAAEVRQPRRREHAVSEDDADFDIDAFFASVTDESSPAPSPPPRAPAPRPAPVRAQTARDEEFGEDTQENAAAFSDKPAAPAPHLAAAIGVGRRSTPRMAVPTARTTGPVPVVAPPEGRLPTAPPTRATGPMAAVRPPPAPPTRATGPSPVVPPRPPPPARTGALPRAGTVPGTQAPSQQTRPIPVAPGASQQRPATPVESMAGPFPRAAPPPVAPRQPPPRVTPRPPAPAPARPPPGMNDADVNALYAKYVQAKNAVGQQAGPGAYGKLLQTINAQAPKIMQQYNAKGVEFSVVVKDNQVVIKAKPKP